MEATRGRVDWSKVRHFLPWEFGDQHAQANVSPHLVATLDDLRDAVGVPVHIHVAWVPMTSTQHAPWSLHKRGLAVDMHMGMGMAKSLHLSPLSPLSPLEQFVAISTLPFSGIGYYPHWSPCPGWHLDLRPGQKTLWTCPTHGRYHYGWRALARALSL